MVCPYFHHTKIRVGFFVAVFVSVEIHKVCVARKKWGCIVLAPLSTHSYCQVRLM